MHDFTRPDSHQQIYLLTYLIIVVKLCTYSFICFILALSEMSTESLTVSAFCRAFSIRFAIYASTANMYTKTDLHFSIRLASAQNIGSQPGGKLPKLDEGAF